MIKAIVSGGVAGEVEEVVTNANGLSREAFAGFNVLSGVQVSVRFKVNNATTESR